MTAVSPIVHAETRARMEDAFGCLTTLGQALSLHLNGLASVGGGETQITMTQRDIAMTGDVRRFGEGVLSGADAVYLEVARIQQAVGGPSEVADQKAHNQ
jgi:hypothetical protein